MSKPKHLYEIVKGKFIAHADNVQCLTLQQENPLGREYHRDNYIYVGREEAEKVVTAIQQWLSDTKESPQAMLAARKEADNG